MEAQTVLSTPLFRCADWIGAQLVVRPHCTPTAQQKDSVYSPLYRLGLAEVATCNPI
jgi:hypothetical protein